MTRFALPPLPSPQALARPWRHLVQRLPTQPPSWLAARALDAALWPRLDADQRVLLAGRCIEIAMADTGLRVRLRLGPRAFAVPPAHEVPVVRIRARGSALHALLRGEQDADRLFFEQALVMEGDTEFALAIKNTLDAIGPLWPRRR
jgi:predicted lipid carrier protein YhbT